MSYIPGVINGGLILTGPSADGASGTYLRTNGAGRLSFDEIDLSGYLTSATAALTYLALTGGTLTGNIFQANANVYGWSDTKWARVSANVSNFVGSDGTTLGTIQANKFHGVFSGIYNDGKWLTGSDDYGTFCISPSNAAFAFAPPAAGATVATIDFIGRINLTTGVGLGSIDPANTDVRYYRNATGPKASIRAAGGLEVTDLSGTTLGTIQAARFELGPLGTQTNLFVADGRAAVLKASNNKGMYVDGWGQYALFDLGAGPLDIRSTDGLNVKNSTGTAYTNVNAATFTNGTTAQTTIGNATGGVSVPGAITASGAIQTTGSLRSRFVQLYNYNSSTLFTSMYAESYGQVFIQPNSGSVAFIQLAGQSSSFAGIKNTGPVVNFRLADDSADANITCGAITASGAIAASGVNLNGTYPSYQITPSGWGGGAFYFQAGVDDTGTGTGNFTDFVNPISKSFSFISGNPNTSGRKHLTIDGATSNAAFSGNITASGAITSSSYLRAYEASQASVRIGNYYGDWWWYATGTTFRLYDYTAGADRVHVNMYGDIGIGKVPTVKLDVNGAIAASGQVTGAGINAGADVYLGSAAYTGQAYKGLSVGIFVMGSDGNGWRTNAGIILAQQTATAPVIVARGAASQTANLQEWQNSAGTVLAYVNSSGNFSTGAITASGAITCTRFEQSSGTIYNDPTVAFSGNSVSEAYAFNFYRSGGHLFSLSGQKGYLSVGPTVVGVSQAIMARIEARAATDIAIVAKGAASQSANLQEWQNSAGTVLAYVNNSGRVISYDFQAKTSGGTNYGYFGPTEGWGAGSGDLAIGSYRPNIDFWTNNAYTGSPTLRLTSSHKAEFRATIKANEGFSGEPAAHFIGPVTCVRIQRTGMVDIGLGTINGDSFAVRNYGDSSTMLAVHATTKAATFYGAITQIPPASVTLATNGQFSIEMTSDTAGNLVYRGSDGTTRRSAIIFV